MLPHVQPETNPQHLMARQDHKPQQSRDHKHQSHDPEGQTFMDRAHHMNESLQMPKQLLHGQLSLGKRNHGGPHNRLEDCMKAHIAHAGMIPK